MGPLFNYNEFKKILDEELQYADELQLILDATAAEKQQIIVLVNKDAGLDKKQIFDALINNYHYLYDMIVNDDLID